MNLDGLHGTVIAAPTIGAVTRKAFNHLLTMPEPDAVLNIESHLYDVILQAENCEYWFDIGTNLWLNRQRWSRLVKEYIDAEHLKRFIGQAQEILRGDARDGATANMLFRDPDRYAKKHRWGGCLMGATFRGSKDHRPTLTFYSRTTYIGYMAFLDAAIAHVLAREIDASAQIGFRWHISSMQLHCFKSLPYVYATPKLIAALEAIEQDRGTIKSHSPTVRNMAKWYFKVVDAYEEHGVGMLDVEKYGPFRRIKRRWLEYKGHLKKNIPPPCPVQSLTFEKAFRP